MKQDGSGRVRLASELYECARLLSNLDGSSAPLRRLQGLAQSLLNSNEEAEVRAVAFILDEWIKDYYLNFAGDVILSAWKEIDEIRESLLRERAADAFSRLSTALQSSAPDIVRPIQDLIVSYLDAVRDANKIA